jgi:hypothetical protein
MDQEDKALQRNIMALQRNIMAQPAPLPWMSKDWSNRGQTSGWQKEHITSAHSVWHHFRQRQT